jgi:hypothetical protein
MVISFVFETSYALDPFRQLFVGDALFWDVATPALGQQFLSPGGNPFFP